tara:strand:+ start:123 stop:743 length:621 start_codon:yes stop_codon:yes gene_type:complete
VVLILILGLNSCSVPGVKALGGDGKHYFDFNEVKSDFNRRFNQHCNSRLPEYKGKKESITVILPDLNQLETLVLSDDTDWKGGRNFNLSKRTRNLYILKTYSFFEKCDLLENIFYPVNYNHYTFDPAVIDDDGLFTLVAEKNKYNTKYVLYFDDYFLLENLETNLNEQFYNDYLKEMLSGLILRDESNFKFKNLYEYFLDTKKLVD